MNEWVGDTYHEYMNERNAALLAVLLVIGALIAYSKLLTGNHHETAGWLWMGLLFFSITGVVSVLYFLVIKRFRSTLFTLTRTQDVPTTTGWGRRLFLFFEAALGAILLFHLISAIWDTPRNLIEAIRTDAPVAAIVIGGMATMVLIIYGFAKLFRQ